MQNELGSELIKKSQSKPELNEDMWKRSLLAQDIKLSNMKFLLTELKH